MLQTIDMKIDRLTRFFNLTNDQQLELMNDPKLHVSRFKYVMSPRIFKALSQNIRYINEISHMKESDLRKMRGIGTKGINELKEIFNDLVNQGIIKKEDYLFL